MIAERWMKGGQRVAAHTVSRDGPVHGEGTVVGYSDRPQVLIEKDDGEKFWWVLDLCTEVEETVTVKVDIPAAVWEDAIADHEVGALVARMRNAVSRENSGDGEA